MSTSEDRRVNSVAGGRVRCVHVSDVGDWRRPIPGTQCQAALTEQWSRGERGQSIVVSGGSPAWCSSQLIRVRSLQSTDTLTPDIIVIHISDHQWSEQC